MHRHLTLFECTGVTFSLSSVYRHHWTNKSIALLLCIDTICTHNAHNTDNTHTALARVDFSTVHSERYHRSHAETKKLQSSELSMGRKRKMKVDCSGERKKNKEYTITNHSDLCSDNNDFSRSLDSLSEFMYCTSTSLDHQQQSQQIKRHRLRDTVSNGHVIIHQHLFFLFLSISQHLANTLREEEKGTRSDCTNTTDSVGDGVSECTITSAQCRWAQYQVHTQLKINWSHEKTLREMSLIEWLAIGKWRNRKRPSHTEGTKSYFNFHHN